MPAGAAGEAVAGVLGRLATLGRDGLRQALAPALACIREERDPAALSACIDAMLGLCRQLYAIGRSAESFALAHEVHGRARADGGPVLHRRAANVCGLLLSDLGDVVGAIDHFVEALRLANEANDPVEASRIWSNMGGAFTVGGSYELAVPCYQRALALLETESGPVFSRFAALANLAHSYHHLGESADGLVYARLALQELSRPIREQDPYGAILLQRSLVRLLIANGQVAAAQPHVREAASLAEAVDTPRARIASATASAAYDLAIGDHDIALTRLNQALDLARGMPAVLRDTLACLVRAEEESGNPERALVRLRELSESVYRTAIERARSHVELARLAAVPLHERDPRQEQAQARLATLIGPPSEPAGWQTLRRLAVSASLRYEGSGENGARVGAMTKALALSHGCSPVEALEIGLASELHDIGLASVPDAILRKRSALNEVERALFLKHVDAGAEILRDDHHPRMLLAREIAQYHHARWDGTGYPDRVGGRFIPLPARLCAVADAYDELVCGLGRRPGRSLEQALAELDRESGTRFDPELVRQFEAMIRNEAQDRGVDASSPAGLTTFRELVASLEEDRGFL